MLRAQLFEWIPTLENIFPYTAVEPINESVDTEPPPLEMDAQSEKQERLVFDSVLGLVPADLREQWTQQAKEREALRKDLIIRRRQQLLPPVRNWNSRVEDLGEDITFRAITTDADD